MSLAEAPALDLQYEQLIEFVFSLERAERLQDRIDRSGGWKPPVLAAHSCSLPSEGSEWSCSCGQKWRRELGGSWTTAK